ncbi:MAG: polymerase sigma factor, sigma-70 family [Sphingobacterium sp.]|jgi:RNA polymerase sigma factor (sigma-70 family)|nr:polymerase sigma factor, sigma-70 family [Sphingobacterium sp.]
MKHHLRDINIDWESFVKGDERIFSLIYKTFYKPLYHYGSKFTQNTVLIEDAIHDLFIRFWKNRARLTKPPSLKNYLYKAFRNHMNDGLKASGRYVIDDIDSNYQFEMVPSVEDVEVALERLKIVKQRLSDAMVPLTNRQRNALLMRYYEGCSYSEIAGLMGITVKATYKLMARSVDAVREGLGGAGTKLLQE